MSSPVPRSWLAPEWQLIAYLWFCYLLNHADRQVVYTLFPALQEEFGDCDTLVGLYRRALPLGYGTLRHFAHDHRAAQER